MPYCQLYYHFVWTTKLRRPLITPKIEPVIYNYLRSKAIELDGLVYALNGVEEHVHLVGTVPPKLAVATFVGQIKGSSATRFNKEYPGEDPFFWQREYGVFTFDKKRLPYIVRYVNRQKEHHASQSVIPVLERSDEDAAVTAVREDVVEYLSDEQTWWQEMQNMPF